MSSKICRFNILGNYRKTDNRRHNQKKKIMHYFPIFLHIHTKSWSYLFQCVCSDVFYSLDELPFTIILTHIYVYIYLYLLYTRG